jgi:hypothetical protein
MTDVVGCSRKERIFCPPAFESVGEAIHNISKRTPARETSRQRCEFACVNFGIDFLDYRCALPAGRKIVLKLLVPSEIIVVSDIISQLRQFLWRQCIYSFFDFGKTHRSRLADALINANPPMGRRVPLCDKACPER